MCGIVGYAGKHHAVPYLLEGLEKLEYRGYDSAGIAVNEPDAIRVIKTRGRIGNLESLIASQRHSDATVGIGHTRWATHGKPNDVNAHPHLSEHGLFCVVHNGIIENYLSLKAQLIADGFHFASETDTEVIAHLLEQNYDGDFVSTVRKTVAMLEGAYALCILCRDFPDSIVCTRWASPLVMGKNSDGVFLASDVTAILKHTDDVFYLDGREIALIENGALTFFGPDGAAGEKQPRHIDWSVSAAQKDGYEHFMLKEIMEQPKAIQDTVSPRISSDKRIVFENFHLTDDEIAHLNRIVIVACGSAFHAGEVGRYVLEKMTRIPVETAIASEFRYRDPVLDSHTLVIVISQSGETADTLAGLRLANEKGAKTVCIVNVVSSSIANEGGSVIYTHAGPEIAVATTKAYSAQVAVLYLLSGYIADRKGFLTDDARKTYVDALLKLPDLIDQTLRDCDDQMKKFAELFIPMEHAYFIGRNLDYACAMEASLKLKEISYIHSEAYAAGELKHGTISLVEKGTLVVALAACSDVFAKTMSNIKEVKARGARVLCVSTSENAAAMNEVDFKVIIPDTLPLFAVTLEVLPMQLLGYYTAKSRGCDIDKPRNLAKSVTVE
ncbi:MAG: glutamine--fructose-6-phosphate transaminase (isomerizing) [Clostridia bacterium]|nr:glutamine--fructose-6-phosphate transaminase (isomerizing) [Clostridia bacterium]